MDKPVIGQKQLRAGGISAVDWMSSKELARSAVRRYLTLATVLGAVASRVRASALFPTAARLRLHWSAEVKYPERIAIGDDVVVGPGCTLGGYGGITLGCRVRLSKGVVLESAGLITEGAAPYRHSGAPIVVGDNVWIGARAMILGGVNIGPGSVIGANTTVTRDVAAGAVVVGNQSRVVESRSYSDGRSYRATGRAPVRRG